MALHSTQVRAWHTERGEWLAYNALVRIWQASASLLDGDGPGCRPRCTDCGSLRAQSRICCNHFCRWAFSLCEPRGRWCALMSASMVQRGVSACVTGVPLLGTRIAVDVGLLTRRKNNVGHGRLLANEAHDGRVVVRVLCAGRALRRVRVVAASSLGHELRHGRRLDRNVRGRCGRIAGGRWACSGKCRPSRQHIAEVTAPAES